MKWSALFFNPFFPLGDEIARRFLTIKEWGSFTKFSFIYSIIFYIEPRHQLWNSAEVWVWITWARQEIRVVGLQVPRVLPTYVSLGAVVHNPRKKSIVIIGRLDSYEPETTMHPSAVGVSARLFPLCCYSPFFFFASISLSLFLLFFLSFLLPPFFHFHSLHRNRSPTIRLTTPGVVLNAGSLSPYSFINRIVSEMKIFVH